MKPELKVVGLDVLAESLKNWLATREHGRLGLISSLDGRQLITLVLDPPLGLAQCWVTNLPGNTYRSLTACAPQSHWFERALHDMFGLVPEQHPRLKNILLHKEYAPSFHPLRFDQGAEMLHENGQAVGQSLPKQRDYQFLQVQGEGVYELPVGPIHAGVIEPGHFRFSCFGETILNLEIRLGYVHRGVEKRITEVPWRKARFVAEAAASDTAAANAIAHAVAIESLFGMEPPPRAQVLRSMALEIERVAVHIIDLGGMGADTGFLSVSAAAGRLRGKALGLGQMLSGSRFLRAFVLPGGVRKVPAQNFSAMAGAVKQLRKDLQPYLSMIQENAALHERMESVGTISKSLALEFGLVGIGARACGVPYDCRQHFPHGSYPKMAPPPVVQDGGDILARTNVRIGEVGTSLDVIEACLENLPEGDDFASTLPDQLPANAHGLGIVEAFRGELIHMAFTDSEGKIKRYVIKDPSFNNWTAISIAIRNNLIADFPLCNKSFALSYSGNDL